MRTSKAISSEISSQMSRKFEEMQTSLNSHTLDTINTAIEKRVLPGVKNAVKKQSSAENTTSTARQ